MTEPALVHDYLLVMRGAERTFAAIAACWPTAPIFTLLCDRDNIERHFGGHAISTSYLQRLRLGQSRFRQLLPLYPRAAEKLPVSGYDLVISSTSAFAHGVRAGPSATHVSYCYSPFRYAWHESRAAVDRSPRLLRPLARGMLRRIRDWDVQAAERVTHYIAISELTRSRIQDHYRRDAEVIHPPVDVDRFAPGVPEDFFLVVSEVLWHKRVEIALEAARRARQKIVVVGGGPELKRLAGRYASSATFLGRLSDERLAELYPRARALVVPNIEEFGIAAVEAQAAGRPVLAADGGGARETVLDGATGVLVPFDDVDSMAEAMVQTDFEAFSPARMREQAERFSADEFTRLFTAALDRLTNGASARQPRISA